MSGPGRSFVVNRGRLYGNSPTHQSGGRWSIIGLFPSVAADASSVVARLRLENFRNVFLAPFLPSRRNKSKLCLFDTKRTKTPISTAELPSSANQKQPKTHKMGRGDRRARQERGSYKTIKTKHPNTLHEWFVLKKHFGSFSKNF